MSKRKQKSIEAAIAAGRQQQSIARHNLWHKLIGTSNLLVIAVVCLAGIGIVGATVSRSDKNPNGKKSDFNLWFGNTFLGRTVQPTAAVAPPPTATLQLSKEYLYAGGARLLAVEDAGAVTTASPSADLVVER